MSSSGTNQPESYSATTAAAGPQEPTPATVVDRSIPRWRRWLILVIVSSALLLIALDNTILYTALPVLSTELGASSSQQLWIINGYPLTMVGLLLGSGALGDRYGHRRIFQIGLVIFGTASLIAAFSPSPEMLIAARLLKGVGAAAMMPATLALIRITFSIERERNLAIAIWSATATVGMALGPLVSGTLLQFFWWGSVFLVNVPIVVIASILMVALGPHNRANPARRWDAISSGQALVGMAGLVLALKTWVEAPLNLPLAVSATIIGLIAAVLFTRRQLRLMRANRDGQEPLVDFAVFKNPGFSGGFIAAATVVFVIMGLQLVITQRYQLLEGFSPLESGMLVTALALAALPFAIFGGAMLHRLGLLVLITGGLTMAALGTGVVLYSAGSGSLTTLIIGMVVTGIGVGSSMSVASSAVMGNVPPRRAGMAASLEEVSYEFGGLLAVSVMGSLLTFIYSRALVAGSAGEGIEQSWQGESPAVALSSGHAQVMEAAEVAFMQAYGSVILGVLIVVALGALATGWMLRRYRPGTASQLYPDNH